MVMVTVNGESYCMDDVLKANLDIYKMLPKRDNDCVIIIDGKERSG